MSIELCYQEKLLLLRLGDAVRDQQDTSNSRRFERKHELTKKYVEDAVQLEIPFYEIAETILKNTPRDRREMELKMLIMTGNLDNDDAIILAGNLKIEGFAPQNWLEGCSW